MRSRSFGTNAKNNATSDAKCFKCQEIGHYANGLCSFALEILTVYSVFQLAPVTLITAARQRLMREAVRPALLTSASNAERQDTGALVGGRFDPLYLGT